MTILSFFRILKLRSKQGERNIDGVGRSFLVPSFYDHFIMEKTSSSPIVTHIYATKKRLLRNKNKSDWLWRRAEKRNQDVGHRERLEKVRRLVPSRFWSDSQPSLGGKHFAESLDRNAEGT